jgi:hypothetical protein
MYFELWDLRTRNLVGEFDTEDEALAEVRDVMSLAGEEAATRFVLGMQDLETGLGEEIAGGAELVHRASQAKR